MRDAEDREWKRAKETRNNWKKVTSLKCHRREASKSSLSLEFES